MLSYGKIFCALHSRVVQEKKDSERKKKNIAPPAIKWSVPKKRNYLY
jgi:uncharacterized Zn finger protein (UPF0148 family)